MRDDRETDRQSLQYTKEGQRENQIDRERKKRDRE
jgi:hypothetical protein